MDTQDLTYVITDETDRTLTVVSRNETNEEPLTDEQISESEANGWTVIRYASDRYFHTMRVLGQTTEEAVSYKAYLLFTLMQEVTPQQMIAAHETSVRAVARNTAVA